MIETVQTAIEIDGDRKKSDQHGYAMAIESLNNRTLHIMIVLMFLRCSI